MNLKTLERREFGHELEKYFRPQSPVSDIELLQGRDNQVLQINRAVTATGRSVFIWGDRGVGKTSLAVASGQQNLPANVEPIKVTCDDRSQMLDLMSTLVDDLQGKNPLARELEYKAGAMLSGFGVERTSRSSALGLQNVNDVARALGAAVDQWREKFRGRNPLVIMDEFDLLPAQERRYFGDIVKQIGDRRLPLTLIFCGVSESFDNLLAGHESASRYIEPVQLERLYLDDCMNILTAGADALGVEVHYDHKLRAAQISDGFPHFVHLLGSSMFWEYYDDPRSTSRIDSAHFEAGVLRAVTSTYKKLEDLYHAATRKYTGGWDYVLWAAADHHQLMQSSNMVWDSYCRIVNDAINLKKNDPASPLPEWISSNEKRQDPFDKSRFYNKMSVLKSERHARVLKGTRAGWYQFTVPMLRGYCRLVAQRYGIRLGNEYVISKPYSSPTREGME
jgi:hypothetical protein